jgi:hypothetical protein
MVQLQVAEVDSALLANARWQSDFIAFMQACHPDPRLNIELVALWHSYDAWCARNDFAPMTAADFCEWLKTTYTVSRDETCRVLSVSKGRV